ncbi:MAG TPA: matrixin family metalloprotease [Chloroflexota bacterium]|jgi:hypothetical protein|nr:matrixin family metalloprotease [Chloroflexota bacterium]
MQRLVALAMAFALVGVPGLAAAAGPGSGSADWSVLRFVHEDGHRDGSGNPPQKQATTESDDFRLMNRLRWLPGPTVEYRIVDEPSPEAERATEAAVATIDRYVTTRTFVHNDATTQTNPCTREPNTIRWAPLDGPGGTLAFAELCFNKKSREIGGFVITLDSGDGWAIGPDGNPNTFDVQSVATHEMGHVAGLDHAKSWKDTCLTMFPFTGPEEIQKRTLGWGDKLGLNLLYNHGDTTPGPGCGA